MSHNAPFWNRNVHICAHFCYKMVHCGIFVGCIVAFVRWVYDPGSMMMLWNRAQWMVAPDSIQYQPSFGPIHISGSLPGSHYMHLKCWPIEAWTKWPPYCRWHWNAISWNFSILIKMSLNFATRCLIINKSALVQVMAWCRTGTKPLLEPMLTRIPCGITRP